MINKEEYSGAEIKGLTLIWESSTSDCRVYLLPSAEDNGWYKLYCFECTGYLYGCRDVRWEHGDTTLSKLFECDVVSFDGVRHLEFNRNGTEMDGYLYYPSMGALVEALSFVKSFAEGKLAEWEAKIHD